MGQRAPGRPHLPRTVQGLTWVMGQYVMSDRLIGTSPSTPMGATLPVQALCSGLRFMS